MEHYESVNDLAAGSMLLIHECACGLGLTVGWWATLHAGWPTWEAAHSACREWPARRPHCCAGGTTYHQWPRQNPRLGPQLEGWGWCNPVTYHCCTSRWGCSACYTQCAECSKHCRCSGHPVSVQEDYSNKKQISTFQNHLLKNLHTMHNSNHDYLSNRNVGKQQWLALSQASIAYF